MKSLALGILLTALCLWGFPLGQPVPVCAQGVKTHFKTYTIFTYRQTDYLCEPYTVKKHDWLYKIFRQKGEISASDFPKFLRLFKHLNPQISNIDAIEPGERITIPLKKVAKSAYNSQRIVEVPVLEFSVTLSPKKVDEYVRTHLVQKGDTISALLDKAFLKPNGAVSEVGKKTVNSLNPELKDINRIYTGSNILIPEPDILNQPWFDTLLAQGYTNIKDNGPSAGQTNDKMTDQPSAPQIAAATTADKLPVALTPRDISRLKRYAQLIQGAVQNRGKVFFPGKNGRPAKILDLSQTPVLEASTGQKTLILPDHTMPTDLDADLVAAIKTYWQDVRLKQLSQALKGNLPEKDPMTRPPSSLETLITALLSDTPYEYDGNAKFSIVLKDLTMRVSLGRITCENRPDLLVNKGNVYGSALDLLETQGYEILDLFEGAPAGETIIALFSKLGYETWENPAFYDQNHIQNIQGIYVVKGLEKTLITTTPLPQNTTDFLMEEGINPLKLDGHTGL